jgi:urea transporter
MFKNLYTLQRRTVFIVWKGVNHNGNRHGQTTRRATITPRLVTSTTNPPQPITSIKDTNNNENEAEHKNHQTTGLTTLFQSVVDTSTKGIGQVIFLNSKRSGQIILGSLAIGDPFLAGMAALGTVTSTAFAQYMPLPTKDTIDNGLYSYNGCLIGCASSVFLASTFTTTSSLVLATTALTITGAASATIATTILGKICNPMPQWTYAFNFVMLTALLRIQPLAPITSSPTTESTTDVVVNVTTTSTISTMDILLSPLTGLSQIFVVESAWTGAGIAAAIASYSPGLAYHAIMGSTIGCLMGSLVYNVPIADVTAGLWGYNAALTSLGVGVFFVPSNRSTALSITGAIATSAIFGAMQPAFTSTPCLTLPFCFTMSACWLLGTPSTQQGIKANNSYIPGLLLASNPHSPEKNSV